MDHGQEKNWGDWREMVVSWTSCGDERWIGRAFFFFFLSEELTNLLMKRIRDDCQASAQKN